MHRLLQCSRRYRLMRAVKRIPGLIAYYPLNEAQGTTTINNAPANLNILNGTFSGTGAPAISTPGKLGLAYNFDNSNDVVTVTTNSLLNLLANVSVIAMIKPGSLGQTSAGRVLSRTTSYEIQLTATNRFLFITGGNAFANQSSLTLNAWQFIASSYNGAKVDHYVNGINVGSPAFSTNPVSNSNNMFIGNVSAANRTFDGAIQHLAIFNRALSASEILNLHHKAGFI